MYCDYCHEKMIGHGVKIRKISHPNIRGYNGTIYYSANRYIYAKTVIRLDLRIILLHLTDSIIHIQR